MADLPLDEASIEVVGRRDLVTERCLCQDFNIETVNDEVNMHFSLYGYESGGAGWWGRLTFLSNHFFCLSSSPCLFSLFRYVFKAKKMFRAYVFE